MSSYRVISSDNHVFEPADLWTSRIEPAFRDRAPHIARDDDGADYWWCDGKRRISLSAGTQAGKRFEEPEKLSPKHTADEIRPGGYIPEEHIKDMDLDAVDVSVIYPTVGFLMYAVPDSDLMTAICRVYNDWLGEFCSPFPKQLKGIVMLNVDDPMVGVRELERCAKLDGVVGAMIPVFPREGMRYYQPEFEPLWAAAQDLGIPLSLHVSSNRPGSGQEIGIKNVLTHSFLCNTDHWVRMSLADMIYIGVFERYPKLIVGAVEHELSWVPFFLNRLDDIYTQRVIEQERYRYKEDMLPSDYFHRNVFLGFQEDSLGIQLRNIIGVDKIMWGSDYPHVESTFPRSRQILEEILVDCTDKEKAQIAGGNAARIYHLD